ncbi:hypothetical protein [Cupriavidus sp. IDO]|uniref:hypothetical protein n=1 Tax=Cupriavidus sp. IDO TaxID=1539142 RepID=UPI0005798EA0|nr:hypothetical protein [Cupriavidus sp. IDO]KWR87326.1 hypothetical protein RM96_24990 [Cupriavidus sp. IDO]
MIRWLRRILPGGSQSGNAPARRHDPSEPFVVNLYDDRVVVHRPDGQREELEWDVLKRVVVRVSDRAPWTGTAWLILAGAADSAKGCVVPLNAANHAALLERLQALPDFNQQKLDNALRDAAAGKSRSDAICWKRGADPQERSPVANDDVADDTARHG